MPVAPPPQESGGGGLLPADVRWPRELDGEYECLGELGRGGMAIVYHARDRELNRDVAVKVVRTRYVHDAEAVARLAREARTVAHLEHPNLVALHAVKRLTDDSLALVMQLVPGKTLKQALRDEGAFSPDRVERVLRDIARALAYAHARGIVHRDVKPENIFLDAATGRALLSDFGVAISRDADTSLTATGTAIGTPTYMSPEQIDGARVDGRSDLYSLGLVAWEMLTGRRPWDGESLYSVIYRQKHEELLSIDALRPDVSERLRFLIDGLLRKQPASRWASAERFLGRLNDASDPPGLKQWRQYKRKQAKQRREALRALTNESSLPEAPTEHFRRSAARRAHGEDKLDARSTPQTIRVDSSSTAVDEWRVEDDGTQEPERGSKGKWIVAAAVAAAGAAAVLLLMQRQEPG
ncbi:MAG: serine/threonine-protein kinase, partial [Gemmatimonadaceae bacterium]